MFGSFCLKILSCLGAFSLFLVFKQNLSGGLIGYWPMKWNNDNPNAVDLSGNWNDGQAINLEGRYWLDHNANQKYSQKFNGINSHILIPNKDSFDWTSGITISAWIWSDNTDGPRVIISQWDDKAADQSFIFKDHNYGDMLGFELSKVYHHDLADLAGSTSIQIGKWIFVAASFDGTTAKIYYNGKLDSSKIANGNIKNSKTNILIGAGQCFTGICEFFSGIIDEIRLFNIPLSNEEIYLLYTEQFFQAYFALNSIYSELNSRNTELNYSFNALKTSYTALNSSYIDLDSNYCALNSSNIVLNSNYSSLNSIQIALSSNYTSLISNYTDLNSNYIYLNSNYTSLNSSKNDLSLILSKLTSNQSDLNLSLTDLNSSQMDLNRSYSSLNSRYNSLNSIQIDLSSNYTSLISNYTDLNSSYIDLNSNYTSLNSSNNDLNQNLNDLYSSQIALNQRYCSLNSSYNSLQKEQNLKILLPCLVIIFILLCVLSFMIWRLISEKRKKREFRSLLINKNLCQICCEKDVNRSQECGHLICEKCVETNKRCPYCRDEKDCKITKIFFS